MGGREGWVTIKHHPLTVGHEDHHDDSFKYKSEHKAFGL